MAAQSNQPRRPQCEPLNGIALLFIRRFLAILPIAFCLDSAGAEDFSWPIGLHGTSASFGSSAQGEYHTETDGTYPKANHNPDGNEKSRLVVEWGPASMGYIDHGSFVQKGDQYWRTWKDDKSLRPDRELSIRGRLLIESPDHTTRRSMDWVQGVRVIVSRLPDKSPDWSRRLEMHDAIWSDSVIWTKGEFLAELRPGEIQRAVGKEVPFQVALSLGEKQGTAITWRNKDAVLPQSVTMLKIPGPPPIDQAMQIINGAPSYDQRHFNPAKLVRAVNYLLPMGKDKAIRELREFLKVARMWPETKRVDDNIDTSDKTSVFLIVHLLFESAEPGQPLPEIQTVPFSPQPDEKSRADWPQFPVFLQDDFPFFLPCGGSMGGLPDQPERHVDWAEKHGRLRAKPLRPLDNPIIAAARLIARPQTLRLYEHEDFKKFLCRQAWNAIEDADSKITKPKPIRPPNEFDEPDWDARLKAAPNLNIHWDQAEQKYILK
jgi:hypothetical protein